MLVASLLQTQAAFLGDPQLVDGWDVYTAVTDAEGSSTLCPLLEGGKKIKIVGPSAASKAVLRDLQCLYGAIGTGGYLHLENVRLQTDSVDGYALYTRGTVVTMKNVEIDGYSGCRAGQSIDDGTCVLKAGGAMRIRDANYSGHDAQNPSLSNVAVSNCCRGFRIQDSYNMYAKDCTATNVSDNAFYFAAGTYTSASGCEDSTFDSCNATNAGQTGFMNIGGKRNAFKNVRLTKSRGAGFFNYNSNDETTLDGAVFLEANTAATTSGWGGAADDGNGAAVAQSVQAGDTGAVLKTHNLRVESGGVAAGDGVPSVVFSNNGIGVIRIYCSFDYTESNFEGGLVHGAGTAGAFDASSTKVHYECYRPLCDVLDAPRSAGTIHLSALDNFIVELDMTKDCDGNDLLPAYRAQYQTATDEEAETAVLSALSSHYQSVGTPFEAESLRRVKLYYRDPEHYKLRIGYSVMFLGNAVPFGDAASPQTYWFEYHAAPGDATALSTVQSGVVTPDVGDLCTRCHYPVSGIAGQRVGYPVTTECCTFDKTKRCDQLLLSYLDGKCCD